MVSVLVKFGAQNAIIFGGIVPFIPQYRQIQRTKDAEGFSTFVCLVLLLANILRIMFWFGKRFELPLLLQSIVMITTMLVMLQLCVETKKKKEIAVPEMRIWDISLKSFWNWTYFSDYILFLLACAAVTGLATFLFSSFPIYLETLGFISVFTEAMLGVPQFFRNCQHRSTEGMSVPMVMCWFSGDMFKTVYFVIRDAPLQFAVCGTIQIMTDIMILLQVLLFKPGSRVSMQVHVPTKNIP